VETDYGGQVELGTAGATSSRELGGNAVREAWVSRFLLMVAVLASTVLGPVARAQNEGLPDRLGIQVGRTREMLDAAEERVGACADSHAGALLRSARELQDRAEAALREQRRLAALQLTRVARERGLAALAVCHLDEAVPDLARRALERTDRVIARRGLNDGSSSHGADGLPRRFRGGRGGPMAGGAGRALPLQRDAWQEFRAGRYESALRLTLAARGRARGVR
jgi:hypothetical protein